MADGVAITAGTGTTIATDDTGATGHAQLMKLAISTDGSPTLIPADATNGLDVDVTRLPTVTGSGSLTASGQAVTLTLTGAHANAVFSLSGTWTATVTFEASVDNFTNTTSIFAMRAGDNTIATTVTNSANNDLYRCTTAGFLQVRARCSAYTSGTIDITAVAGSQASGVFLNFPLPPGTNNIGDVDILSLVPGTTATSLGKAEDAAHTDGDTGVLMLGVRNYTGAGTDGDFAALSVASDGLLKVENHPNLVRVSVQSSGLTTATTAYSIGDQVGTQFTFAGCARASGGGGYIVGATVIDAADIIGAYDLVVTRASVTLAADNAAYAISDADALEVVALIQCSGAYDIGNNRIAQAQNIRIPYTCNATSLFAGLITRSAHTFFAATTNLQVILHVELS